MGRATVRPRWVWTGLVVAIAGAVTAGAGVAVGSWTVSVVGAVVLVAGGVIGYAGGGQYDVHASGALSSEAAGVRDGHPIEGTRPGDMIDDPEVRKKSRRLDGLREQVEAQREDMPRPAMAPLAALVLGLVAAYLVVAQWTVYADSPTGQVAGQRSLGLGIVLGLVALRVRLPGRHRLAALLAVAAGAGLVAVGLLADHDPSAASAVEVACGVLAVVAALVAVRSPQRRTGTGTA